MQSNRHSEYGTNLTLFVAPGCAVIDNITNGEVKSSQNGSVVEITCQPGTVRQGEATLTCDGKTWSAEVPECLGT